MRWHNFRLPILLLLGIIYLGLFNSYSDTVFVWSADGSIKKISTNGNSSVIGNLSGWNGPVGLAIDSGGNLISGSPSDSGIRRFTPNGATNIIGEVDSVSGLAYDRSAVLYASIPNYTEICRPDYLAGPGYYLGWAGNYTQSQLSYPTSIAISTNEILFVANGIYPFPFPQNLPSNTVVKFSKNFEYLGTFASGLNQPWGLAFDLSGNLFVSNFGDHRIYKYAPSGDRTTFATSASGIRGPQGLAFDSAGNLYVANSVSNNILKYSPAGAASIFATGLVSPCSIAIQPGLSVWNLPAVKLTETKIQSGGSFYFSFTNTPDVSFSVLASTNLFEPLTNWAVIGPAAEIFSGYYYFTDTQAANISKRFYRVRRP